MFDLDDLIMLIGGDRSGKPVEIGVATSDEGIEFVVHAMAAPAQIPEVTDMPRSMQEILDHADELAATFEQYEPSPDDEIEVTLHLLRRAALNRARSERQVAEAVVAARAAGLTWKQIGEQIGTSAQGAQQRYGARAAPA